MISPTLDTPRREWLQVRMALMKTLGWMPRRQRHGSVPVDSHSLNGGPRLKYRLTALSTLAYAHITARPPARALLPNVCPGLRQR